MAEAEEDSGCTGKDDGDVRRTRAPSKKKFDEDMEALNASIRHTEEQLEAIKTTGPSKFADELKSLKAEKNANIERRKKIDTDLQKLNKDITEMMHNISRLESTLHYRSEDKIDQSIKRLEWSLKVQNFKLSQEKKIVAEIDSLRRSKKTLMQYLSMKKDKDAMRDRQRRMREERDYYFHKVTQLKQKEEKLRSDTSSQRARAEQLKKELDRLYETKRQMVSMYRKQRDDFFDDREKRRHESFKKRQEEKQAWQAAHRKEIEEYEAQKLPYDDNICLCNTLINYLHRFISSTELESSSPRVSLTPPAPPPPPPPLFSPCDESPPASGPAEELEDGQYVLLRRSEDDNYVSCSAKHAARKQRRSRKQSVVKRITHTPEVLAQFLQLNLNAPTTVAEILASMEQLVARKLYYEREAEVKSELSVTESAQCEVSRQASHTESIDGLCESRPSDHIMEQLLLSVSDHVCSDSDDVAYETENVAATDWKDNAAMCFKCSSATLSQSAEAESSHSGSRSEGSDSTPRNSITAEGGCGGTEEGRVARGGSAPDCFTREDSSYATVSTVLNSDMASDCSDVFCAKKAQPARSDSSNICSDFASKVAVVVDRSSAGKKGQPEDCGKGHICECKARESTSLEKSSCSPCACDNASRTLADSSHASSSSAEEFPALVRGGAVVEGRGDRHGRDAFFLQGNPAGVAESTRL